MSWWLVWLGRWEKRSRPKFLYFYFSKLTPFLHETISILSWIISRLLTGLYWRLEAISLWDKTLLFFGRSVYQAKYTLQHQRNLKTSIKHFTLHIFTVEITPVIVIDGGSSSLPLPPPWLLLWLVSHDKVWKQKCWSSSNWFLKQ